MRITTTKIRRTIRNTNLQLPSPKPYENHKSPLAPPLVRGVGGFGPVLKLEFEDFT